MPNSNAPDDTSAGYGRFVSHLTRSAYAMILAGGRGSRLLQLTDWRAKPAVPFGGKYRIIDFVLSNFVNSGIFSSYILVQYMSQSLIEYMRLSWRQNGITNDQFLTVVPPQMRLGEMWYRGTADAIGLRLQGMGLPNQLSDIAPYVATLAALAFSHVRMRRLA